MANKLWEGHERREHDEECKERIRSLKEWISDKICIATKGTKSKQAILWTLFLLMLGSSGLMTVNNLAYSSEQKAIDAEQTAEIEHTVEQLKELLENTEKTAAETKFIREEQVKVQTNQSYIQSNQIKMMNILERIDRNVQ